MSQFQFSMNPKVNDPHADVTDAALGTVAGEGWGSNDLGKIVKLTAPNAYGAVAADDEIEGVLVAVETHTVNDGFGFGSVQRDKRFVAVVGAGEVGTLAVGDLVVADAYGSGVGSDDGGYPRVKGGAPTTFKWRVLQIKSGTGAAGDTVVIERV